MKYKLYLYIVLIALTLISCSKKEDTISDFTKIGNFTKNDLPLDYTNSYKNGFVLPKEKEDFIVKFNINNNRDTTIEYFYKIYYQNESYKFDELKDSVNYNELASENFYGSYENTNIEFKSAGLFNPLESKTVIDSFKILGNPREEKKFFNENSHYADEKISNDEIESKSNQIKNNKDWLKSIKEKAIKNELTLNEQIHNDAVWMIKQEKLKNNRWQRNLRVGNYSFLIVVCSKNNLDSIPKYIKNISITKNGLYINPYYYFLYGSGKNLKKTYCVKIDSFINVKATPPFEKGIYVEPFNNDTSYYNNYIGSNNEFKSKSAFEYYKNERSIKKEIYNIPKLITNYKSNYNEEDYINNSKIEQSQRKKISFTNSNIPGKTFGYDKNNKCIWFKNPASDEHNLVKENVGIKTRNGFTYGKYTFKIKMSKLLNDSNIWNGLTNAIWLFAEDDFKNERRFVEDTNKGYMPYYGAGKDEKRVNQISYSEIDFEMVKADKYWPKTSYKDGNYKISNNENSNSIIVACTNWDMACMQPEHFDVGVNPIKYENKTFDNHRWDHWYNALSSKIEEKDNELFGKDYYYFQIEWKPKEIIWRIGPEKNDLRVVGYMNDKVTSIPNNQMLCIITQEFHFSNWWPNSPYKQENIPFISEDLKGYLYSIEIE